jgi:hypothetical protein
MCWFFRIFVLGISIFKGLTERRLYKSFGVKWLIRRTPVVRLSGFHKGRAVKNFRKQQPIQLQGYDMSEGYVQSRSECEIAGGNGR